MINTLSQTKQKSVQVMTAGRTDLGDLFELSGLRTEKKRTHYPFLVFVSDVEHVQVKIIDNPIDLLTYSDVTPVMVQWGGRWRSDFFQFTVGEFRAYTQTHPKKEYHIV